MSTTTILAGTTFTDTAHGLDYTPDIDNIQVTPQDDLAGRSYWVSDVGAATYRINISGIDLADHLFSVNIVGALPSGGAGYCTATEVRQIIGTSKTDGEIEALIVLADTEIDARSLDSRSANIKKLVSMNLTAALIASKEPRKRYVDGASEEFKSSEDYRRDAEAIIGKTGGIAFGVTGTDDS